MSHSRIDPAAGSAPFAPIRPLLRILSAFLLLPAAPGWAQEQGAVPESVEAVAEQAPEPDDPAPQPADAPADDAASLEWEIEGYLSLELEFRNAGAEDDLDLYLDVVTDVRRPGEVPLSARFNGRLIADLVGDAQGGDLLYSVWDTFDHDVQSRTYEAYVRAERLASGKLDVTGGRMFVDEGLYLHFDGARVDLRFGGALEDLTLALIGGVPVRFGETGRGDTWLAGAVAGYRLADSTRLRLEYYHVSEFVEGFNFPVVDPNQQPVSIPPQHLDDDYLGFTVWHRLAKTTRLYGRFSLLNGDANELQLRGRWVSEDRAWQLVVEYYQLFGRLTNVTNDLTPFVPMLGSYEPFARLTLRATRRFGELWIVQAGLSHRELLDEGDEGTFNHEYNHYYASVTRLALLDDRLDASLLADGYAGSGNDVAAVGGWLDYRLDDKWTLRAGVDYAYYKYDFLLDTEREHVWTYGVEARYRINPRTSARARLSVSEDRFETWTTFELRISTRF